MPEPSPLAEIRVPPTVWLDADAEPVKASTADKAAAEHAARQGVSFGIDTETLASLAAFPAAALLWVAFKRSLTTRFRKPQELALNEAPAIVLGTDHKGGFLLWLTATEDADMSNLEDDRAAYVALVTKLDESYGPMGQAWDAGDKAAHQVAVEHKRSIEGELTGFVREKVTEIAGDLSGYEDAAALNAYAEAAVKLGVNDRWFQEAFMDIGPDSDRWPGLPTNSSNRPTDPTPPKDGGPDGEAVKDTNDDTRFYRVHRPYGDADNWSASLPARAAVELFANDYGYDIADNAFSAGIVVADDGNSKHRFVGRNYDDIAEQIADGAAYWIEGSKLSQVFERTVGQERPTPAHPTEITPDTLAQMAIGFGGPSAGAVQQQYASFEAGEKAAGTYLAGLPDGADKLLTGGLVTAWRHDFMSETALEIADRFGMRGDSDSAERYTNIAEHHAVEAGELWAATGSPERFEPTQAFRDAGGGEIIDAYDDAMDRMDETGRATAEWVEERYSPERTPDPTLFKDGSAYFEKAIAPAVGSEASPLAEGGRDADRPMTADEIDAAYMEKVEAGMKDAPAPERSPSRGPNIA